MARSDTYSGYKSQGSGRTMKDLDTWLGNSLATILAGLAIAAGVIGLLVAFGYLNDDGAEPFQDAVIWMLGGLILGICANVFRREHHVVDPDVDRTMFRGTGAGSEPMERTQVGGDTGRMSYDDRPRYDDTSRVPPHTH
jgi:hypothetical protein